MDNDSLIRNVLDRLVAIGFPSFLEWEVRVHSCFLPKQFTINYEQYRANDQISYSIVIKHDEGKGVYSPIYYDAILKKGIEIPNGATDRELLNALNQEMQLWDWCSLIAKGEEPKVRDLAQLKRLSEINQQLTALECTDEGAYYVQLMKARYWTQSPFEMYVPSNTGIRQALEVTQRFHFFEGEDGITLEEAHRFLSHRWREKQLSFRLRKTQPMQKGKRQSGSAKKS